MAGPEAKTRSRTAGLRFLSALAALAPAPAWAGAWIAPDEGQQIWSGAVGVRGDDEVAFLESSIYLEQPLQERISVVATPWVEQGADVGEDGWRAEMGVGVKAAVLRDERNALAIQGSVVWNSWPDFGCAETGAELRFLAGRSFGASGFVNAEYGRRVFDGNCGGERVDLTAGYRPADGFLVMGQVFYDAALRGDETVKAQISVVRFGMRDRGIQIGLRARIDDGITEPALVVAYWGRPGD